MKDPKKVKAGAARWSGVTVAERKRIMGENGKKGGNSLWAKIRSGKLSTGGA